MKRKYTKSGRKPGRPKKVVVEPPMEDFEEQIEAEQKEAAELPKEDICTVEGCTNPLAKGQPYVCQQHIRRN